MIPKTKQTKRLAVLFLCAFLATSFHSFSPNGRFLQSLSQNDGVSVDDNHNSLEVESIDDVDDDGCWRECPQGRVNRIFYNGGGRAGLNDRKFVIENLAELAGYLCAQLVVSEPYTLLNEQHNNGKHLSHNLHWKDLFYVKFVEDDKPVIVENEVDVEGGYDGYLRVISHGGSWKEGFEKVQEHSWTQEQAWRQGDHDAPGFVWELTYSNPYNNDLTSNDLPMLRPDLQEKVGHHYNPEAMAPAIVLNHLGHGKPVGCQYVEDRKDEFPEEILMIKKVLIQKLEELSPNTTFGNLHLRRGDAINQCDTQVGKVRTYLSCSLQNTEAKGQLGLLLTSDEQDDNYRQDILDLANDYSHITMIDLDKMITQVIEEAVENGELDPSVQNNYFEYDIEGSLDEFYKFHLERRRTGHCDDCTPVLAELM